MEMHQWSGRVPMAEFDLFRFIKDDVRADRRGNLFTDYLSSRSVEAGDHGSYALVASRLPTNQSAGFLYPAGISPVYFIGNTIDAHATLIDIHRAAEVSLMEFEIKKYKIFDSSSAHYKNNTMMFAAAFGATIYWWDCPEYLSADEGAEKLIVSFMRNYGSSPLCNSNLTSISAA